MTYSVFVFENAEKYINEFLGLPKRIYAKNEIMQNEKEELSILKGTHILSHYFTIYKIIVMDENGKAVSRAILTTYENDDTAYLGYFESEDNEKASRLVFEKAESLAREKGYTSITGPVDASFWIKYRLKINKFNDSYTGEPYNKNYYLKLWESAGYQITEHYSSNRYSKVENNFDNEKFSKRLAEKKAEGYVIKSPSKSEFNKTLCEVYDLLIDLYSSFPVYKHITKNEFVNLYGYLEKLVRYNMVKMAYYGEKPVGFFISIPNYKNIVYGKLGLADYIKILKIHAKPNDYVMLYMGIDFSHKGLGKAVAETIKEELKEEGTPSVGALIRQGNINIDYFKNLIQYEYEYVLLSKNL